MQWAVEIYFRTGSSFWLYFRTGSSFWHTGNTCSYNRLYVNHQFLCFSLFICSFNQTRALTSKSSGNRHLHMNNNKGAIKLIQNYKLLLNKFSIQKKAKSVLLNYVSDFDYFRTSDAFCKTINLQLLLAFYTSYFNKKILLLFPIALAHRLTV